MYLCIVKNVAFFLALILLTKPALPVLEYAINYEYISTVLCINKEEPKLECNGKCHLKEQLANAAEDEKPISSDKKSNAHQESEVLFFVDDEPLLFNTFLQENNHNNTSCYTNLYKFSVVSTIFHPPSNLVYFLV